jgi:hypothetical protein
LRNPRGAGGVDDVMAKRLIGTLAFPVVVIAVLVGCVVGPTARGGSTPPQDTGTLTVSPAIHAATASPGAEVTAPPHVPSSCHLTKPTHPFVPPAGYPAPARPPENYDAEWYGKARLWTMLRHDGEVWIGLPRGTDGVLGQKTFWWSADFHVDQEPQPAISVTGRQLDGPGQFITPAPGTNAAADFGSAMLTGIAIPSIGCWQITATYRHASLSYVVWVG